MKRKTVAIDLDATLAFYEKWEGVDKIGDPLPGSVEFVNEISRFADVVIFTTRTNADVNPPYYKDQLVEKVDSWLRQHGFNAKTYAGTAKPLADAYVDDRAVVCRPLKEHNSYFRALADVKRLCSIPS